MLWVIASIHKEIFFVYILCCPYQVPSCIPKRNPYRLPLLDRYASRHFLHQTSVMASLGLLPKREYSNCVDLGYRSNSPLIVNPISLSVSFRHQSCFDRSMEPSVLKFIVYIPSITHCSLPFWKDSHLLSGILLERLHFIIHCLGPLGIFQSFLHITWNRYSG